MHICLLIFEPVSLHFVAITSLFINSKYIIAESLSTKHIILQGQYGGILLSMPFVYMYSMYLYVSNSIRRLNLVIEDVLYT